MGWPTGVGLPPRCKKYAKVIVQRVYLNAKDGDKWKIEGAAIAGMPSVCLHILSPPNSQYFNSARPSRNVLWRVTQARLQTSDQHCLVNGRCGGNSVLRPSLINSTVCTHPCACICLMLMPNVNMAFQWLPLECGHRSEMISHSFCC